MTDTPERIWVCPQYEEKAFHDFEFGGWPEYVRADDAKAAIATARAEALEEAAKEMEQNTNLSASLCCNGRECGCHGASVGEYAAFMIRALKEKPNG